MTQNEINQFAAQMQTITDKLAAAVKIEESHYKLNGKWIKRTYPRTYRPVLLQVVKPQEQLAALGKALELLDA